MAEKEEKSNEKVKFNKQNYQLNFIYGSFKVFSYQRTFSDKYLVTFPRIKGIGVAVPVLKIKKNL